MACDNCSRQVEDLRRDLSLNEKETAIVHTKLDIMIEDIQEIKRCVKELDESPKRRYNLMINTFFTAIISALIVGVSKFIKF